MLWDYLIKLQDIWFLRVFFFLLCLKKETNPVYWFTPQCSRWPKQGAGASGASLGPNAGTLVGASNPRSDARSPKCVFNTATLLKCHLHEHSTFTQ